MNVIKQPTLWVGWCVGCGTPVSSPTALTAGTMHLFSLQEGKYRMAGNFGGKIFWRIAENMSFDGIYFGG